MDAGMYSNIGEATFTGNPTNGIKWYPDEWYSLFDLKSPAVERDMPSMRRREPDLQDIMLSHLPEGVVSAAGVSLTR